MTKTVFLKPILQIYEEFQIPISVQKHMIRTMGVANLIVDNWKGPKINPIDIYSTMLIHDLGNIVKMDFISKSGIKLLGQDINKLDYFKELQIKTIKKYGENDILVTQELAKKLGVNERILFLLENKEFHAIDCTLNENDFDLKICLYADQRVAPYGVLSLEGRYKEALKRYFKRGVSQINSENHKIILEKFKKIERQILSNTNLTSEDINDNNIKKYFDEIFNGEKA